MKNQDLVRLFVSGKGMEVLYIKGIRINTKKLKEEIKC